MEQAHARERGADPVPRATPAVDQCVQNTVSFQGAPAQATSREGVGTEGQSREREFHSRGEPVHSTEVPQVPPCRDNNLDVLVDVPVEAASPDAQPGEDPPERNR